MEHTVKVITSTDTYAIRHIVLRTGKPIESCIFDGDNLSTTIHLGLYIKKKLVGVCSLLKNDNQLLSKINQYQLRGMAILEEFQTKGLGASFLKYGESLLKEKNIKIMWCNARDVALGFYKKSGYQIIGDSFNIPTAGLHFAMYKKL